MQPEDVPAGDVYPRPATPENWHVKKHHSAQSVDNCCLCGRARTVCSKKMRYLTPRIADGAARKLNESNRYPLFATLVPYRCRWCLHWHLTTAKSTDARRRVNKQRRKWLASGALVVAENVTTPLSYHIGSVCA